MASAGDDIAALLPHLEVRAVEGSEISRRPLQRDLIALAASFPIGCDEEPRHDWWCWLEDV